MLTKRQRLQIAGEMVILIGFITALFTMPEIKTGKALGASPYPPPGESVAITTTPEPYPAPGEIPYPTETSKGDERCNDLKSQLPTDRVVAVSSDCQISDFETQAQAISKRYEDLESHDLIMPPTVHELMAVLSFNPKTAEQPAEADGAKAAPRAGNQSGEHG